VEKVDPNRDHNGEHLVLAIFFAGSGRAGHRAIVPTTLKSKQWNALVLIKTQISNLPMAKLKRCSKYWFKSCRFRSGTCGAMEERGDFRLQRQVQYIYLRGCMAFQMVDQLIHTCKDVIGIKFRAVAKVVGRHSAHVGIYRGLSETRARYSQYCWAPLCMLAAIKHCSAMVGRPNCTSKYVRE
jgi:hypothetical protein